MKKQIKRIVLWVNILFALALSGAYAANYINPEYFWYFAFLGLAYPILLIINVCFIVFWLWRKKWLFLISLATILLGWQNVGKIMQIRFFQPYPVTGEKVNLLSYNVRAFNFYQWENNTSVCDSILYFIRNQHTGIVFFQEFLTTSNVPMHTEKHIDTLLQLLPYKHIFYTYKTSEYSSYGLATYSRYPIVKKGSIRFKNSYNACIYSDIKIGSDTIRFFNVHLQSVKLRKDNYWLVDSPALRIDSRRINEVKDISGRLKLAYIKRAQQVDELSWYLRRSPYPVIICGDFNDTPISYTYTRIRGKLADAFLSSGRGAGSTYRGISPSFRIDFIFHSKSIESSGYQTHAVELSDHTPISCELTLHP